MLGKTSWSLGLDILNSHNDACVPSMISKNVLTSYDGMLIYASDDDKVVLCDDESSCVDEMSNCW